MIRWREESDHILLSITRRGGTLVLLSLALLALFLTFVCPALLTLSDIYRPPELAVVSVILLFLAIFAFFAHATYCRWGQFARVQIDVHGSYARWESSEATCMRLPIEVRYFHRINAPSGGVRIDAVLQDGGRLVVLGPWPWFDSRGVDKLVAQMNEYLCADSSPPTEESQP